MFLPTTSEEIRKLGWERPDVILATGDAYIDSPYSGAALIGKSLMAAGYKTAVISQPDMESGGDILRLGSPRLFWGVTSGATDSMVANYTSSGKRRRSCDFTPGGENTRRPDRAVIAYTNLIKRFDKTKAPVVLGGIEASLRRFAHYDSHTDSIRRSVIFDAKADYLIYGMGEYPVVMLANMLSDSVHQSHDIPNLVYIAKEAPAGAVILPSFEEVKDDKCSFHRFFKEFYQHASCMSGAVLAQKTGDRWAVQNPSYVMSSAELDRIHGFEYEWDAHPYERAKGKIPAIHTARFSIQAHRGCFGECSFCAISVHQGRRVVSRSEVSIIEEAIGFARYPDFKGNIADVGGATANMYGAECGKMRNGTPCADRQCLYPAPCPSLNGCHGRYNALLSKLRSLSGIKRVFISSGIRFDLALADKKCGEKFTELLAAHHTSGQIKLAPEHSSNAVLRLMGKPDIGQFERFCEMFLRASERAGKRQFVTCYFMVAHPGCKIKHMKELDKYIHTALGFRPEQAQIFTPTPSTHSTCMYHTELAPDGETYIYVAKSIKEKTLQKEVL